MTITERSPKLLGLLTKKKRVRCTVPKSVPIIGIRSLQGPFWRFGSLFIFQGPYFQCFGFIHAKNVNLVYMYTTMSYLDLSVMSNDLHCYYTYMLFRFTLLANLDFDLCLCVKFHKSSFWILTKKWVFWLPHYLEMAPGEWHKGLKPPSPMYKEGDCSFQVQVWSTF